MHPGRAAWFRTVGSCPATVIPASQREASIISHTTQPLRSICRRGKAGDDRESQETCPRSCWRCPRGRGRSLFRLRVKTHSPHPASGDEGFFILGQCAIGHCTYCFLESWRHCTPSRRSADQARPLLRFGMIGQTLRRSTCASRKLWSQQPAPEFPSISLLQLSRS